MPSIESRHRAGTPPLSMPRDSQFGRWRRRGTSCASRCTAGTPPGHCANATRKKRRAQLDLREEKCETCDAHRFSREPSRYETKQNLLVVHEVLEVPGHHHGDFHELVHKVVREVDVVSDTAGHTRDVGEEAVHAVLVPAQQTRRKQKGL